MTKQIQSGSQPDDAGGARVLDSDGIEELSSRALSILEENWLGHATRPGRLYPHQWSWDAAAIAMGRSSWDQARAEAELRSLFAGQWSNGLLPHIVFTDAEDYFPGPEFWATERSSRVPEGARTSGIVQPPIHATAAWRLFGRSPDREAALAFAKELFPKLAGWHDYLYRERVRGVEALAEVWHPWESGMDNSPAWDEALARIQLEPKQVPAYTRVDNALSDAAERPSDFDYDRYAFLVDLFRRLDYDGARIGAACPFVVQPALFNSLLVQSSRDLARLARVVGADPAPFEAMAGATLAGLEKLWDPDREFYYDYDVRADERVRARTIAGFSPLYAGAPSSARAAGLIEQLKVIRARLGDDAWGLPSVFENDPCFAPQLYWRGPVWPIYQWVLYHGASRYGYAEIAERVRATAIDLCQVGGFWEHYDPETGRGQGIEKFAWTAGLILDLLSGEPMGTEMAP